MGSGTSWRVILRDGAYIFFGSLIFAIGLDTFEAPCGLAPGGVSGIAIIVNALGRSFGLDIPIGVQTIVMNGVLIALVARRGNRSYLVRTVAGFVLSGLFIDLLAPVVPKISTDDLLLCALWGGVLVGLGIGLVFRSGGNTGGTDIIALFISRETGVPVGTVSACIDAVIVACSIPVFSLRNALYAAVAIAITGWVLDAVVDGPRTMRVAYVVSTEYPAIAQRIMHDLDRGCTELTAKGSWSGEDRPMLMCVLDRAEAARLKQIVSECDPDAIVFISDVHEAFGEGFRRIED